MEGSVGGSSIGMVIDDESLAGGQESGCCQEKAKGRARGYPHDCLVVERAIDDCRSAGNALLSFLLQ